MPDSQRSLSRREPPATRRSGLSLFEVLVAAALGLALLTLLVQVLVPMMRAGRRGSVQIAIQQTALTVLDRLTADMQRSVWSGLSHSRASGYEILGVHRLDQVGSTGQQTFEDALVIFVWQGDLVTRRIVPPNSGDPFTLDAPFAPSPGRLTAMALNEPARESRSLGGGVQLLTIDLDAVKSTVATRVRVMVEEEHLELSRTISLRNVTL